MAIRKYAVPRQTVYDGFENELADVRGLNFADLNNVIARNFDNLDRLMTVWDHYQEMSEKPTQGAEESMANLTAFLVDIAQQAPGILVEIIATGADATSDQDVEDISKWPMHAQLRAVMAIYALTIVDFGGPAKLLGVAVKVLRDHAPKAIMKA